MSIFWCVDQITKVLPELKGKREEFFRYLLKSLQEREQTGSYIQLIKEINLINSFLEDKTESHETDKILEEIRENLKKLNSRIDRYNSCGQGNTEKGFIAWYNNFVVKVNIQEFEPYKIATVMQCISPYGLSHEGNCLGIGYAMADPKFSPYKNKVDYVRLNRTIYDYQTNQASRKKDQQTFKRSRLTHTFFSPIIKKQAEEVLSFAKKNQERELILMLSNMKAQAHAVYLSVQMDGKIKYMDSNFNAYLFTRKEDFITFYARTLKDNKYYFYEINELIYDPNNDKKESLTFKGIIRSVLTGKKYSTPPFMQSVVIQGGLCLIWSLSLTIAVFSPLPLFCLILVTSAALIVLSILLLSSLAYYKGMPFIGLLTVPYFINYLWHDYQQKKSNSESSMSSSSSPHGFFSETNNNNAIRIESPSGLENSTEILRPNDGIGNIALT